MNSHDVKPEVWEHARQALVFYFSRRHAQDCAEDLAQETLAAILTRDDFEFDREEDFLRVCYAFAAYVSKSAYRKAAKHSGEELSLSLPGSPAVVRGLNHTELGVYLREVLQTGESRLSKEEWQSLLDAAAARGGPPQQREAGAANRNRVKVHRARGKLDRLVRWRNSDV